MAHTGTHGDDIDDIQSIKIRIRCNLGHGLPTMMETDAVLPPFDLFEEFKNGCEKLGMLPRAGYRRPLIIVNHSSLRQLRQMIVIELGENTLSLRNICNCRISFPGTYLASECIHLNGSPCLLEIVQYVSPTPIHERL